MTKTDKKGMLNEALSLIESVNSTLESAYQKHLHAVADLEEPKQAA
ncbi:hypothetical protein [Marinobacter sp. Hex_13]|nr:hypothetical protein [Marinobacter sp. Hex_13]